MADAIKLRMICAYCGSLDVSCDAAARWDEEDQEWTLTSTFDKGASCEPCGGETRIAEVMVDPVWTESDQAAAEVEGWNVFNYGEGAPTVCKDNDSDAFANDEAVLKMLQSKSRFEAATSPYMRALALHYQTQRDQAEASANPWSGDEADHAEVTAQQ